MWNQISEITNDANAYTSASISSQKEARNREFHIKMCSFDVFLDKLASDRCSSLAFWAQLMEIQKDQCNLARMEFTIFVKLNFLRIPRS